MKRGSTIDWCVWVFSFTSYCYLLYRWLRVWCAHWTDNTSVEALTNLQKINSVICWCLANVIESIVSLAKAMACEAKVRFRLLSDLDIFRLYFGFLPLGSVLSIWFFFSCIASAILLQPHASLFVNGLSPHATHINHHICCARIWIYITRHRGCHTIFLSRLFFSLSLSFSTSFVFAILQIFLSSLALLFAGLVIVVVPSTNEKWLLLIFMCAGNREEKQKKTNGAGDSDTCKEEEKYQKKKYFQYTHDNVIGIEIGEGIWARQNDTRMQKLISLARFPFASSPYGHTYMYNIT